MNESSANTQQTGIPGASRHPGRWIEEAAHSALIPSDACDRLRNMGSESQSARPCLAMGTGGRGFPLELTHGPG